MKGANAACQWRANGGGRWRPASPLQSLARGRTRCTTQVPSQGPSRGPSRGPSWATKPRKISIDTPTNPAIVRSAGAGSKSLSSSSRSAVREARPFGQRAWRRRQAQPVSLGWPSDGARTPAVPQQARQIGCCRVQPACSMAVWLVVVWLVAVCPTNWHAPEPSARPGWRGPGWRGPGGGEGDPVASGRREGVTLDQATCVQVPSGLRQAVPRAG